MNALATALAENQTAVRSNEAELQADRSALSAVGQNILAVPSPISDPEIQKVNDQITAQEILRAGLVEQYKEGNFRIRAIDASLVRLRKELDIMTKSFAQRNMRLNPAYMEQVQKMAQLQVTGAGLQAKSRELTKNLSVAKTRLANYPQWQRQLDGLQREFEQAKMKLAMYENQNMNLDLRRKTRKINATIIERAEVPTTPIRPQKAQNIVFAGLLGLFLGLCLAFLQEFLDDRVNSPDEADRILRLPNLGHIPVIEEEGLRLIRDIDTFSPILESYRSLRTNINFAAVGNPVRSLVVTSSGPGEGKSTTTANPCDGDGIERQTGHRRGC